jgi:hypothetical protein
MSTIRVPVRPNRGRILIAALAILGAAILLPTAAGAGPKPKTHHLVFRLSGPSHQDVIGAQAIALVAHCPSEACTVTVSASSTSPAFRTPKVHAQVPAGGSERITVPLSATQGGKLKAALKAGHAPILTVHAIARDGSGDKVPLTLTVRTVKS